MLISLNCLFIELVILRLRWEYTGPPSSFSKRDDLTFLEKWLSQSHTTSCKYVSSVTPKTHPNGTWYTFKSMNRKSLKTATFMRLPLPATKQLMCVSIKMLHSVARSPFTFRVFSE